MTGSYPPIGTVVVIVPTYNERENLEPVTARVRTAVPDADLLIVDDNSPDGTGELADKLAAADARIHVLHRPGKSGLGAAYVAGFGWALDRGYDAMVEMDADGSHQPEDLPRLLAGLDRADLVVGTRWMPGGKIVNWPKSREILSRGANIYTRVMLGIAVRDATGGFRAYRAGTLRAIPLDKVVSQGYCFQIDLTLRTIQAGLTVAEIPITFVERARGHSKMSNAIVREAFWRVAVWGVSRRTAGLRARIRPGKGELPARPSGAGTLGALALLAPAGLCVAVIAPGPAPLPDDRQPLGEHLFQVGDGAPFHQHVPVTARRLGLRSRRFVTGRGYRGRAAHTALPLRWHLCLSGEGHAEPVALRAIESDLLAWGQVGVTIVLIARGAKASAT